MPRNVDPSTLGSFGPGKAPAESVGDTALVTPERDTLPLKAHVDDPSRAHMAVTIGITDTADCFASDEVEGALEELCQSGSQSRMNGLISGGTFTQSFPHAGNSLTLAANSTVRIAAGTVDISGATVSLTSVADGTAYIYVDADPASGTYRTVVASASLPEVETAAGVEDVMLAKVTWASGGPTISDYQDARFFVRNLDRKVQYSSRQGENVDAWSEGCFATLSAAFFWLENYSAEETKSTLLIRGTHSLTAALEIPVDDVIIRGDGGAILTHAGAGHTLFTVSTASASRANIALEDLTFECGGSSDALVLSGGNELTNFRVERCRFTANGATFVDAIDLSGVTGTTTGVVIRDCDFTIATTAVNLSGAGSKEQILVENCSGTGPGTAAPGPIFYSLQNVSDITVQGGKFTEVPIGVQCTGSGSGLARFADLDLTDVGSGMVLNGLGDLVIDGCSISLDATDGATGIQLGDSIGTRTVTNSSIATSRSAYGGAVNPRGIDLKADSANGATYTKISNCTISGFLDTDTLASTVVGGIYFDATAPDAFLQATISQCNLIGCAIQGANVQDVTITETSLHAPAASMPAMVRLEDASRCRVESCLVLGEQTAQNGIQIIDGSGCVVDDNTVAATTVTAVHVGANSLSCKVSDNKIDGFLADLTPPTATGILINDGGTGSDLPVTTMVSNNHVTRCYDGIIAQGVDITNFLTDLLIEGNVVTGVAHDQDVPQNDNFAERGTKCIGLEYCQLVTLEGNSVHRCGEVPDSTGTPIVFADDVFTLGMLIRNCDQVTAGNNNISNLQSLNAGTVMAVLDECRSAAGGASPKNFFQHFFTDNVIVMSDDNDADLYGFRINVEEGSVAATYSLSQVQIVGGSVTGKLADPFTRTCISVLLGTNGSLYNSLVEGVQVTGYNINGIGLQVEPAGDPSSSDLYDFKISNCMIQGNGEPAAPPAAMAAIGVGNDRQSNNASSDVSNLVISNNHIFDVVDKGVLIAPGDTVNRTGGTSTVDQVEVRGNLIEALSSLSAAPGTGVGIHVRRSTYNADYSSFRVEGNTLRSINAATAVRFDIPEPATTELEVTNNTLEGQVAFVADQSANDLTKVRVENNEIDRGLYSAAFTGVYFALDERVVQDVRVDNNVIAAVTQGGTLGYGVQITHTGGDGWSTLSDLSVSNNQIGGGASGVFIDLNNTVTTPVTTYNVKVDGNQVYDLDDDGGSYSPALNVTLDSTPVHTVNGISVSRNKVSGEGETAINCAWEFGTAASALRGLTVDENQVFPGTAGSAMLNGISITGPTTTGIASLMAIDNISVSRNRINTLLAAAENGTGINVEFVDVEEVPYYVKSINVDGNQVHTNSTSTGTVSGIELNMTCNYQGLSISHNVFNCEAEVDWGIRLYHEFTGTESSESSLANRYAVGQIDALTDVQFQLYDAATTLRDFRPVRWESTAIVGNSVICSPEEAIIVGTPSGQRGALTVAHVREVSDGGGGIDRLMLATHGMTITGNVLRGFGSSSGNERYGFRSNSAEISGAWPSAIASISSNIFLEQGWSVSGNSSTNFATEISTVFYGQCVYLRFPASGTPVGALVGNIAQDSGTGGTGWAELLFGSSAGNSNFDVKDD